MITYRVNLKSVGIDVTYIENVSDTFSQVYSDFYSQQFIVLCTISGSTLGREYVMLDGNAKILV